MGRYMRGNKSCRTPQACVVVDTETVPERMSDTSSSLLHRLYLGHAVFWRRDGGKDSCRDEVTFKDRNTFWNWLIEKLNPRRPVWLFAHNVGFDLTALRFWELLETGEFSLGDPCGDADRHSLDAPKKRPWRGLLVSEDPPTVVVSRHSSGAKLVCCDTMNWLPMSLEKIGEKMGVPKLPFPGDEALEDSWVEYCKRDVQVCEGAVRKIFSFISDCDLGNIRYTVSSQSLASFKHNRMDCPIVLDDRKELKALERQAYYGARREVYFNGNILSQSANALFAFNKPEHTLPTLVQGKTYRLDLCQAYPTIMRDNEFPTSFVRREEGTPVERLKGYLRAFCAVADVTVDSGYEPFPVRTEQETEWCRGKIRCALCGPELKLAIDEKLVKEVHAVQLYVKDRPFKAWAEYVLGLRKKFKEEGDGLGEALSKLLANSLYGKFGQRASRWETVQGRLAPSPWGLHFERDADTGQTITYRSVGWVLQQRMQGGEADDNFPLISAYVTAYHRMFLRFCRNIAGLQDVYYEDADSLHVSENGLSRLRREGLVSDTVPGRFRVEGEADVAIYLGIGHYRFGDDWTIPGRPGKARPGADGGWTQDDFRRLDAALCARPLPGVVVNEIAKRAPLGHVRGTILSNGWVEPRRYLG